MTLSVRKSFAFACILFAAAILIQPSVLRAQEFETGLELYQKHDYERAISAFNKVRSPEASLFTAKSFYAMGRYQQAQSNLNNISSEVPAAIFAEAQYTSGLIDFQLKEFGDALTKLNQVFSTESNPALTRDARSLYRQILNYLTADQRIAAIQQTSVADLKFDLLESALGKVDYSDANRVLNAYKSSADSDSRPDEFNEITSRLSDPSRYTQAYGRTTDRLRPPEGTIYNIGVALPEYQPKDREFEIVKSLYFGALLAGEKFNRKSNSTKASVRFVDTGTSTGQLRSMMEKFSKEYQGDGLIGPLFSDQAKPMIPLASDYKIPTIAPLANSQVNSEGSYLFQYNPTFMIHGKEMARYAVQKLNMKRFAVIARRGSAGASSAEAFRDEAERLGAQIVHYFIEDLRSNDFEVSQYTQYFGSQEGIDAVYAPFTGEASLTLIDLLLVDLRVMNNPPLVLGSQEWQQLNYASNKYSGLDIYFSQGYYVEEYGADLARFKSDFRRKFGMSANQFAMIGYDAANFLLEGLEKAGNPALLKSTLLQLPRYNGLANNIEFAGGNTNTALKIIEVTGRGDLRVRQ